MGVSVTDAVPATADTGSQARHIPLDDPPTTGGRRWSDVAVLAGTIAGIVTIFWFLLVDRLYFGNDDLLQFDYGQEHGLSRTTASQFVFQHFAPVNRLAHYLVLEVGNLSPLLAFGLVTVAFTAMLAVVAWLSTELGLALPNRVAVLLASGLSVTMFETAGWFDGAMHILPALTMTYAVVAAHVRAVRTGRARWHVVATVLFALGPLTQERPLFALPLVVAVDLLLVWRLLPWRERLHRLWALRLPLGVLMGVGLGLALAIRAALLTSLAAQPDWALTLKTMLAAVTGFFLPSLVNYYPGLVVDPDDNPSISQPGQFVILVAVLALGVALARVRRGNSGPLLFAAATICLYYGFLKFSPLLIEESYLFDASRLTNAVYVTIPVVLALAHLRLGWPPRWLRRDGKGGRILAWGTVAVLGGYLASSVAVFVPDNSGSVDARNYLDNVRAGAPEWSDQDVTVLPLFGNPAVATSWAVAYGLQENFFPLVVPGWQPSDLTDDTVVVDADGRIRDVELQPLTRGDPRSAAQCAPELGSPWMGVPLPNAVAGQPMFVQLSYQARESSLGLLHSYHDGELALGLAPIRFAAGRHTALFPLRARAADLLAISALDSRSGLCIEQLSVVRAVLSAEEMGGSQCGYIDWYGRLRFAVGCPT